MIVSGKRPKRAKKQADSHSSGSTDLNKFKDNQKMAKWFLKKKIHSEGKLI